jgi:pyruvate/2-oxoglutarate dehydrogenase complex dihydrolipoamide acyltransferase (E2) component
MWHAPDDPQIYGAFDVDATDALRVIARARALGHHLTPTHLVGRAVSHALAAVPELNVRIVGLDAIPRPSIDVFFITAVAGGKDLSGSKVVGVDKLSAVALAAELAARTGRLRSGKDPAFARSKRMTDALPKPALRFLLHATAFMSERWQLHLPSLGITPSPFGSAMVTSVGMFGLPQGFAPLAWMYDVPLLVLVGEITERPVVVAHQVVVRPVIPLTATLDHRYVDGAQIGRALGALRAYLEQPSAHEPELAADQA